MEEYALFLAYGSYLVNGLDSAYLVVCIHYSNKGSILADSIFYILRVDESLVTDGDISHLEAVLFKVFRCMEHSVVLEYRCDDVLFALFSHELRSALDSPVVGLGTAACEVYLAGLCTQSLCHLFTGGLNCTLSVAPQLVNA